MKILVIAAHPDDEVLGCGGRIAKYARQGDKVAVCILTDGCLTRYKKSAKGLLRAQARACAKVLRVSDLFFEDLPNQMLDTLPVTKVIKTIERVIAMVRPDIVYTHDKGDLNRDHCVVHEATLVACRPLPGARVRELYSYFVPSSSEYNNFNQASLFTPNVFVDIEKEIETKVRAFACYKTEARAFPHPRSPEALRAYAAKWGSDAGFSYAEPFRLVRWISSL